MASAVAVSTVGKAYLGVVAEWWDNLVFQLDSSSRSRPIRLRRDQLPVPRGVADRGLPGAGDRPGRRHRRAQRPGRPTPSRTRSTRCARTTSSCATRSTSLRGAGRTREEQFATEVAPIMLAGKLTGRRVLVRQPAGGRDHVEGVLERCSSSPAPQITGRVDLQDKFIDPDNNSQPAGPGRHRRAGQRADPACRATATAWRPPARCWPRAAGPAAGHRRRSPRRPAGGARRVQQRGLPDHRQQQGHRAGRGRRDGHRRSRTSTRTPRSRTSRW